MTLSLRPGALALLVAACAAPAPRPEAGGPGPVMRAARAAEECVIVGDRAAAGDTFTVALPGAVSPARAPVPETPAERFLFRALYETLIELDCAERVLPGLAEAWASEDGGRRWTFVLRGDARFWDGEPVTAHDVAAAWAARDTLGEFAPWDGPVAQAVQVMSERVIAVRLRWPYSEVPRALTHPGLAVAKAAPGLRWPIGTGRYWLSESGRQMALVPAFGDALPVLRFQPLDGGDARDLLDAGADLLVTDDPAALSYAGRRPDLGVVPLPWDRTYLFVPGPDVPAPAESGRLALGDREALARDVVRAAARRAAEPFWLELGARCAPPRPSPPRATPSVVRGARRIAFLRADPVARDLAHRLVAVASGPAAAAGLSAEAFAAELRTGAAAAYVMAAPRVVLDACLATEQFVARAPWLHPRSVTPLVDVRPHAVVRRGFPSLVAHWDGALRVGLP